MAKSRQNRELNNWSPRGRRALVIFVALAAALGVLGVAYAQSSISLSLNSPVSFPVDI